MEFTSYFPLPLGEEGRVKGGVERPMKPPLTLTLSPRRGEGIYLQRYNTVHLLTEA
jgi:hypothetical protein